MFDVVVRDGNGRPLVDLDLSEIELVEDGKRQTVTALFAPHGRVLPGAALTPPSPAALTGTPTPLVLKGTLEAATPRLDEAPSAVAFVFDELSPEARALAARVADSLLAAMPEGDWVGVFGLGHRLYVAQSFTRDREAAKTGVARMAQRPSVVRDASGTRSPRTGIDLDPGAPPTAGAESAGGGQDLATQQRPLQDSGPEVLLHAMEMRMSGTYLLNTRDAHGVNAAVGLRAVAGAMAGLPGRKAIVLFSEGIPVTDRARTLFETMVGTANRAGVTFYTVDAAGLRAQSAVAAMVREQDSAGRTALGDAARSQGAWTRDLEDQALLVRSGGTATLARLAKETGGILLEHTNSVERMARRIAEDQAAHYLLAYTPTMGEMDGSYRRVTVRVRRKGAAATHRSGYWAVAITP